MDEKELDERLGKLELPQIELDSHRCALRTMLVTRHGLEKQARPRKAHEKIKVFFATSLKPPKPAWKPALAISLAAALMVALGLVIGPLLKSPSGIPAVKIDDWIYNGGPQVTTPGTTRPAPTTTPPVPGIVLPPAVTSTSAPGSGSIGLSAGGAKGVDNFRENIAGNYLPLPTDMTCEGLFYDYYFDTGRKEPCDGLFCPSYTMAVTADPFSGQIVYYLSVGLNSGLKESDFARKSLNLVIVLDISGSMGSPFDSYYYDRDGSLVELGEKERQMSKIDAACRSVSTLLDHLDERDRFGMVLFDSQAYLAKPLNPVAETDMDAIKEHVAEIEAGGSTNLYAGMTLASQLFEPYLDGDQAQYENRIIFITDAMPNTGPTGGEDFATRLEENAASGLYSTFLGVGVDFNSELVEKITKTRGANYYSVHSPDQFTRRIDEEFDYMVTPLVFDLEMGLDSRGWEIERVYGSPEADLSTGQLMKVNTLFPSSTEDGETRGGLILLKLKKTSEEASLNLNISYEDRNGKLSSNQQEVQFESHQPEFFGSSGIRKGVLLARYTDLVTNWLVDEREHAHLNYPWEPTVNHYDGILAPPDLGQWERTSLPLAVSPAYRQLFAEFAAYFEAEARALGDETLGQELEILAKLATG